MAVLTEKATACSVPSCHQNDFLPFTCKKCQNLFCVNHYEENNHMCNARSKGDRRVFLCPKCLDVTPMMDQETEEEAAKRHASACTPQNYQDRKKKMKGKTCPVDGCKERLTSITTYKCRECNMEVCIKHRLPQDHICKSYHHGSTNKTTKPKASPALTRSKISKKFSFKKPKCSVQ